MKLQNCRIKSLQDNKSIFGSDSAQQFSTVVIILHRPELYNKKTYSFAGHVIDAEKLIACHVLKQRDGWTGLITWEHDLANNRIWDKQLQLKTT